MKSKKEIFERAFKTFIEAFIPAMTAALASADLTEIELLPRVLTAIAISAAATGISAVWNGIIDPILKENKGVKVENSAEEEQGYEEE